MRVASLLPSATEMVHFCGAGGALVGVTHECDYPPGVERLPHLTSSKIDPDMTSAEIDAAIGEHLTDAGSIYALDAELLDELAPDLVLTQGLCDVCAVSLSVVERATVGLTKAPRILSMKPPSLGGMPDATVEVGEAVGRGAQAREGLASLRERLARVEEATAELPPPRAGCIEWLDPPFSPRHRVPGMVPLVAGG